MKTTEILITINTDLINEIGLYGLLNKLCIDFPYEFKYKTTKTSGYK